jgi:hypothetical protein
VIGQKSRLFAGGYSMWQCKNKTGNSLGVVAEVEDVAGEFLP